ncbi:hypothetical protein [Sphingobium sp. HWE2-09]|uniref:hypothetical protein n=1 Tax=Sphingobium sp. HWE2-09 TaxID=3108390 RepID=UPI002DC88D3A|nr:hypothetical protein [Sphingobium sp. HWE2-09]
MSDHAKDNESEDKLPQPDMAQAEQILFYQDAPIGGSASFQEAVQAKANFAQRIPGTSEWTIGNGVGSLSQLTREEMAQKEKEESAEWFEDFADAIDHIHEQERQREEWAQARHSYAGIEMTGEEWGEFADQLKGDTPLRKWLMEKLKKEGKTEAKATEMVDQMSLLAKMQSLPPNQWTDEMKALDAKLDADPALRTELERDLKEAKQYETDAKMNGQKVELNAEVAKSDTPMSTEARADILSQGMGNASIETSALNSFASTLDGPAIASDLNLREHHKAALAAEQPLDAPKQIAALTPPSGPAPTSPGGGFDV